MGAGETLGRDALCRGDLGVRKYLIEIQGRRLLTISISPLNKSGWL